MTDVIDQQAAEQELGRWVDSNDLELDTADMDADDLAQFTKRQKRLLKALRVGALVIDEEGLAVYTPQNRNSKWQNPIVFHERTGADVMAMDKSTAHQNMKKTYAVMGSMCRVPPSVFAGLVGIDGKICEGLYLLLMD